MSIEVINLEAVKNLLPALKLVFALTVLCVLVWYGTVAFCVVIDKIVKMFDRGRLSKKH